jgi:cell division protein FtsA
MAKSNIIVGLDIGTSKVRAVVASIKGKGKDEAKPRIIGVGESISSGMRRGAVVGIDEMTKSIKRALDQAERGSGVSIEKVFVSMGGNHIQAKMSKGIVAVSRADEEVSEEDVIRVINNASAVSLGSNREIIHVIPREFSIDGQEGIRDPRGMTGIRLEVDALIIEGLSAYIKNLRKCLNSAGVEIEELILNVLAASNAVLTKKQKELGVLVLDIGGGTVSMAVYEEMKLLHVGILPIGASHITNDIAIGLRTSVETAEKVKLNYGTCLPEEINKKDAIDLSKIDEKEDSVASRKEVARIIEARTDEIFSLVNKELRRIGRERLLPSGAILVGGGSKIPGIIDLAKDKLKLSVQLGYPQGIDGLVEKIDDPAFATAIGLIFWAMEINEGGDSGVMLPSARKSETNGFIDNILRKIKRFFKTFIP